MRLQPVDPGEVFQDAAGEGDDQVDVDVGVVFNASVTKGEQTLVYASSYPTLYARNSVTRGLEVVCLHISNSICKKRLHVDSLAFVYLLLYVFGL